MGRLLLIYVSGIDGSGKTTVATFLYYQLKKYGLPVVRIWFRFPYFFLYPILLLARKLGLTKVYESNSRTLSVHFFEPIASPYTILFVFDFALNFMFRVILRSLLPLIIIIERGPLDSLVDLLSDISRVRVNSVLLKFFLNLQKHGIIIVTSANLDTIKERRAEAKVDPKFTLRYKLYKLLILKYFDRGHMIIIDSQKRKEDNFTILRVMTDKVRHAYGYLGYGKKFSNPYLKALFANRWIILASNWLVQGSMIADPVENIVRFTTDLISSLIVLILTANPIYSFITFLLVHTLNYIFNSNSMHIMRFFRRVDVRQGLDKILTYLEHQNLDGIEAIVVFGSLVRNEVKPASDLDIRVIRKSSISSTIKAYVLITKLRLFALRNCIPLDIFIHTKKKLCRIISLDELKKIYIIPHYRKEDILKECQVLR